jgi:large conductance mechanosensitive channel
MDNIMLGLRKLLARNEPISVAVGIVIGLASFYLIQAVVAYLIAPLIAVFIGDSLFELNAFTVNTSEFRYGAVIEAAMTFALVLAVTSLAFAAVQRRYGANRTGASNSRACPECTREISIVAKRCPYCTAPVGNG